MHISIFEYNIEVDNTLQIALLSFERQRSYPDIASILYDEYRTKLQLADALIIRPPVDIQIKDLEKEITKVNEILKRFPHFPVYLIFSHEYFINLSKNINLEVVDILSFLPKEKVIQFLQQKEMEDFVLNSSSLFRSPENTIYRTPSQEYSHAFLRVGNIQISRYVLDAIFFWTIPYLKNIGSVLTDSWSISSIALNISRLLCRYDQSINITDFHVNMLASHYNGLKKLDKETENSLFPLMYETEKNVLFLLSAVKTQKSLDNIQKIFTDIQIQDKLSYLALYKLIKVKSIPFLCDLANEFSIKHDINFDSYKTPPNDEQVIEIDDKIFFPLKTEETEIDIRIPATLESADFFRRYETKEVISIHRDAYYLNKDKFRHHGLYIDLSKMLQCEVFCKKLKLEIEKLTKKPALIIYPPHEHAKDLVDKIHELIFDKFSTKVTCYSLLDTDFESTEHGLKLSNELKKLTNNDIVLIVDDVSTTGSRLRNYQKKLRDLYTGQIHYFIGLARPDKEEKWQSRTKDLQYRPGVAQKHIITFIEKIVIPDWDEKNCPWCCEARLLQTTITKPENKDYPLTRSLKKRFFDLTNSLEKGMINNVFYSVNSNLKPAFQGGSIFSAIKEISEADLVAIIATAIQHLRNKGIDIAGSSKKLKLDTDYPFFKILKLGTYLGEDASFNEALIKASILRTAYKSELRAMSEINSNKQKECVVRFFEGKDLKKEELSFFMYELYIALKEGKLPKPNIGQKLLKILEIAFDSK